MAHCIISDWLHMAYSRLLGHNYIDRKGAILIFLMTRISYLEPHIPIGIHAFAVGNHLDGRRLNKGYVYWLCRATSTYTLIV